MKVTKGEGGWNQLALNVDSSTFTPGEYLLTISALDGAMKEDLPFTILEYFLHGHYYRTEYLLI